METRLLRERRSMQLSHKKRKTRSVASVEHGAHRRMLGTILLSMWMAVSVTLLIPFALTGILSSSYINVLNETYSIFNRMFLIYPSEFTSLTLGLLGSGVALYSLTTSGRALRSGPGAIEYEVAGAYISWINWTLSTFFAILLVVQIVGATIRGFTFGPAYMATSCFVGYIVCGFLSGIYSRGEYARLKSIRKNQLALEDARIELSNLADTEIAKPGLVYLFQVLASIAVCSAVSFIFLPISVNWYGFFVIAAFGGVYFGAVGCMATMIKSAFQDKSQAAKSMKWMTATLCTVAALSVYAAQILLTLKFFPPHNAVHLVLELVIWAVVLIVILFGPGFVPVYREALKSARYREMARRIESLEFSIEQQKVWLGKSAGIYE